jgi:hypothetical protein
VGRIEVFSAIAVIWISAGVIHLLAAAVLGPTSTLHVQAVNSGMGDSAWAMNIYEVLTVWVPITAVGGSAVFGFVYEYRYQRATALTR